jgi:hypothetical protein
MEPKFKIRNVFITYDMDKNDDLESPPGMESEIRDAITKLGYTVDSVESSAV